jgi:hypothetical protein
MNQLKILTLLTAGYLVALFIQMPAQFLNVLLDQYFEQKVSLATPEGSLWNGGAHVTLNDPQSHRSIDLGKIAWNIEVLQILTGKLALNMRWNEGVPFWLTIDASRLHIEHATFNMPGQVVQFLVPSAAAAELGGQITVHAENFSLTNGQALGNFEVNWDRVTSPLSDLNPLGNYTASFEGVGDVIKVTLKTQSSGLLLLQGAGQVGVHQPFQFEGNANAVPDKQAQLQQVLQLIGNEAATGSGNYRIKI